MNSKLFPRRQFLKQGAVITGSGALLSTVPSLSFAKAENITKKRCIRIAHLTDIHVQPEGGAIAGMTSALHTVQNMKDKPEVIFNGGDCVMDALKANKDRTKAQWEVWHKVMKGENSLEVVNCIGNHDVWGWSDVSNLFKKDKTYGKKWAMEELLLPRSYYSFDRAGWHFIVLDSTFPAKIGYTAKLDEPQFDWLSEDLARTPATTPVCVLSHIPIISFCPFFDGDNEKKGSWKVPGSWMHIDARRIKDLFRKHPNVKVCLSGHIHLQDKVEYLGVNYYCNGAVSGGWWGGNYQEFPPAFAVVDLFDDGSSTCEMVAYGGK